MSPKKEAQAATKGFTAEEKAAMKERARELKAAERAEKNREKGEADVMEKIAEMPEDQAAVARRLHELIKEHAPQLWPKTWYGMPAYARDGEIVCFFQAAAKFNTRYSTLGFNDSAKLDDGAMWPVAYALTRITEAEEKKIIELIKKAVS